MVTKGAKSVSKNGKTSVAQGETEDLFADEPSGEFGGIPQSLEAAIGATCSRAVRGGGYFGISVTDDGGSCRLAVRTGKFHADRRFYKLADFSAAIAKVFSKLGS